LATPRFLLRLPYGKKTDPIDSFAFEEFTRQEGLGGMLWGHPALIPGLLLAETFAQQGAKMRLGTVMGVGDIPYYVYVAPDGEQVALPCTERLYSERQAVAVSQYRVMPLLSIRGKPELRLGGFTSVAGSPLAGFWAPGGIAPPAPPPTRAAAPPPPRAAAAEPAEEEDASDDRAETETTDTADTDTTAAAAPDAAGEEVDLDKLLADLNAAPPPAAADETEPDLDALLASLK
ncbi:MAG TPA: type VI secretion system contractile sheath large subunit, partial [Acetobacteraceae bacterium]|nr:type VI secretion system contractile sheath large subunit [Acetobacteraceae bacterium]